MFLSLVFLAELVAGISGFVFRHEVSITYYLLTVLFFVLFCTKAEYVGAD